MMHWATGTCIRELFLYAITAEDPHFRLVCS